MWTTLLPMEYVWTQSFLLIMSLISDFYTDISVSFYYPKYPWCYPSTESTVFYRFMFIVFTGTAHPYSDCLSVCVWKDGISVHQNYFSYKGTRQIVSMSHIHWKYMQSL